MPQIPRSGLTMAEGGVPQYARLRGPGMDYKMDGGWGAGLAQAGKGLEGLGRGLSVWAEANQRAKDAEDAGNYQQIVANTNAAIDDNQAYMNTNPGWYDKFNDQWDTDIKSVTNYNQKLYDALSDTYKKRVNAFYTQAFAQHRERVVSTSFSARVSNALDQGKQQISDAMARGDFTQAAAVTKSLYDTQVINQGTYQAWLAEQPHQQDIYDFKALLRTRPGDALKELDAASKGKLGRYPLLTADEQWQFRQAAEQTLARNSQKQVDALAAAITQGDYSGADAFRQAHADGQITDADYAQGMATWNRAMAAQGKGQEDALFREQEYRQLVKGPLSDAEIAKLAITPEHRNELQRQAQAARKTDLRETQGAAADAFDARLSEGQPVTAADLKAANDARRLGDADYSRLLLRVQAAADKGSRTAVENEMWRQLGEVYTANWSGSDADRDKQLARFQTCAFNTFMRSRNHAAYDTVVAALKDCYSSSGKPGSGNYRDRFVYQQWKQYLADHPGDFDVSMIDPRNRGWGVLLNNRGNDDDVMTPNQGQFTTAMEQYLKGHPDATLSDTIAYGKDLCGRLNATNLADAAAFWSSVPSFSAAKHRRPALQLDGGAAPAEEIRQGKDGRRHKFDSVTHEYLGEEQ